MSDIDIRVTGQIGRITFTRPKALNAMTYDMCMAIDAALTLWAEDHRIAMVALDAEGDKAFCAGGDIAELYATGTQGNYDYGRTFWRDEYRLNARIFEYPKPVVSLMQGFVMGGGVGIGCHGSHRVVCETTQIAMPECGIGLVPDVGGSLILALAPGRLGEYLGTTGARMGPADAIHCGFADTYIPREKWNDLLVLLEASGDPSHVEAMAHPLPAGPLQQAQGKIDRCFGGETLGDVLTELHHTDSDFAAATRKTMGRNSPLSMACAIEMVHRLREPGTDLREALELEYRYTFRSMEHGDFLEGIRAQIIDKDRNPNWQYADLHVPATAVSQMLMPLGADTLTFD